MALVDRVKNILLTPKTEWPQIAGGSDRAVALRRLRDDPGRDRADRDADPRPRC